MNQLLEILKAEGRRIIEEFNLSSWQGEGSPQEVADFREHAIQDFVARFFPQSYIVSKGKVTDLEGKQSDSIDCLILNPEHPNLVDSKGKFRIIFSDACDAAIEVKPNLARTDELERSLKQCISVKNTKRKETSILLVRRSPPHIVEHSLYVPFFIFTLKAFDPTKLYSEIVGYYRTNGTPIEHQIDGVCIHGIGMLKNIKHKEMNLYKADFFLGQNSGWYLEKWGETALLGLLISLEYSFPGFPKIADSIIRRLVPKISKAGVERLGDTV